MGNQTREKHNITHSFVTMFKLFSLALFAIACKSAPQFCPPGHPGCHPGWVGPGPYGPGPVNNGMVSFTNGRSGIVMVNYNGRYNTVCDDNFGYQEAQVICRQIFGTSPRHSAGWNQGGYSLGSWSTPSYLDRSNSGNILWDDMSCNGGEYQLSQCGHRGDYSHNCGHGEDAWVVCN